MAIIKRRSYGIQTGTRTSHTPSGDSVTTRSADIGYGDLNVSMRGFPHAHPFESTDWTVSGSLSFGSSAPNLIGNYLSVSNDPSYFYQNSKSYPLPVTIDGKGSQLFAGTNPTRPHVQLPVFLFELREIPMMLNQAGAILLGRSGKGSGKGRYYKYLSPAQRAASANLAYNFGWKPLVNDVKRMFDFKDAFDKRQNEWNRLYSSSGLRRRMSLGGNQASGDGPSTYGFPSYLTTVASKYQSHNTYWGTVKWVPTAPSPYNSRPTPNDVRRMIFGLHSSQIIGNVWEAIPWSWLVDWFSNVGDVLQANQGRSMVRPQGGCIMVKQTSVNYHKMVSEEWGGPNYEVILTAGSYKYRKHYRFLANGSVTAYVPDLSGTQLSILGSLALLKGR